MSKRKSKPTKPNPKRRANRRRSEAAKDGKVGRAAAKVSDEFSVPSSTGETKRDRKEERERETATAKAAELGVAQVVTIGRHHTVVRGDDTDCTVCLIRSGSVPIGPARRGPRWAID